VPLWKFSVATLPEAEDAITELLETTFKQPASSYFALKSGATLVSVYLKRDPLWNKAKQDRFAAAIKHVKASGLDVGPARIKLQRVRSEDWAHSWKRHFKPLEIGSALLIRPSWSNRKARNGQAVVVLDPGLSFGTGQHPTTAFCLEQIASRRAQSPSQSFLDIGTGSGILAISAAKLGYAPVKAIDCDPAAVRIARANARKNRVADRINFSQEDITRSSPRRMPRYSLICANLISTLLLSEGSRILARLDKDGILVLAGILKTEFSKVQRAYQNAGMRLIASRSVKEWRSGAFAWE
jgi:ribosomal protein L11 methyltransferase